MRTLEELKAIVNSDQPERFYKTAEWKEVRIRALQRDHYECKRCVGEWTGGKPVKHIRLTKARYVHHIEPLKEQPQKCIELDNLVSLCFSCHEEIEERSFNKEHKQPLTIERW